MLQSVIDFLGKRLWIVAIALPIVAIVLFFITTAYPVTVKLSYCEVKDNTVVLHDTTYRVSTVMEKTGGAVVRLCVREVSRTKQDNLVQKLEK